MAQVSARDRIRTAVLNAQPDEREVTLFGEKVVLRTPTIRDIVSMEQGEDKKLVTASMIVKYTFVPDSNEKVFDEGDVEDILNVPFNSDINKLLDAMNELMGIGKDGVEEQRKNS